MELGLRGALLDGREASGVVRLSLKLTPKAVPAAAAVAEGRQPLQVNAINASSSSREVKGLPPLPGEKESKGKASVACVSVEDIVNDSVHR